jgi:photosystem II stability/assembly factor-like uncharacterized protein
MKTFTWRTKFSVALLSAVAFSVVASAQRGGGPQGPQPTSTPEPLKFRYMGPAPAGRIATVAGVPGDANTYYLGSASGGLWKSTDGGASFAPIFDDQPVSAIGAIAVADSDPNILWVGTGEPWVIRYSDVMGDGVYVSKDAGKTWTNMGLKETGRIARVLIHPTNPNTVYVCASGRLTGPQEERGVFKTTDGGANWQRVLFVDPNTGCSGLSMDPKNPDTLLAGTWQVEQHTWVEKSGGPGSGVYLTRDGGAKWTKMTNGMPKSPYGKVDVQIAPSDGKRMYALIQTADQGSVWRSDDTGATWKVVSWDRSLIGRAGYYIRMVVNPQNPDDIFIMSSSMHRSQDGGKNFSGNGGQFAFTQGQASCGDCHDIWIDPKDPVRYALVDDGGANVNTRTGQVRVSLPNGQMYHVHVDNRVPYWIYSNRQDDGTMRGPSTSSEQTGSGRLPAGSTMPVGPVGGRGRGRGAPAPAPAATAPTTAGAPGAQGARGAGGAAPAAPPQDLVGFGGGRGGRGAGPAWEPNIGGCESGFTIPDPADANIVYASCYGNKVTRWDARTGTARSIEPWMVSLDSPPNEAKYRCHWTAPMAIDPFDSKNVLYGCQLILKTSNGGQSWTELSPDLSTRDPSRIVSNGGLVGDNLGQYNGEVVWSIEYSKIQRGLIWAGTNDGKLWYTKDGGARWNDVTKNVKDLPVWGAFNQIWPSTFDPGTAYVAVSFHLMDDRKPYIYKTTDFGATWSKINGNIPTGHPLDYVLSVSGNPNKKGMLFAGTARAFYYSLDDGGTWTRFKEGLPPVPVSWITVEPRFHDVAISTYGRGLYILPNITLLEQTGQTLPPPPGTTKLYEPAPIFRQARSVFQQASRPHFQLALGTVPASPVKMEILDGGGKVVKAQMISAHAGMNGINWDLLLEAPKLVELRTTPPDNPHIWEEARFQATDIRRITHWGITPQTGVPMAAPGKYQVRFTVDGTAHTQPFEVIKDPAVAASVEDLQSSTATQMRIRDDITQTSEMVNKMEIWRKQIEDQVKANAGKAATLKSLSDLDKAIRDVEMTLVSRSEIHSDDKYFPEAYKVYMNLIWLSGGVGQGASDEAGSIDYKPTDTQMQVLDVIEKELASAKAGFDKLVGTDLPAFNKAMAGKTSPIGDK